MLVISVSDNHIKLDEIELRESLDILFDNPDFDFPITGICEVHTDNFSTLSRWAKENKYALVENSSTEYDTLYTLVIYRSNHRINPHDKMEKSTEKV